MRGIAQRLGEWLHATKKVERFWCISICILVAIGLILPSGILHAANATTAVNYLLMFIAFCLQWIIIAVAKLVLFLIATLIKVAEYNTFTEALPVTTGWTIMRDVVNMFFIVVLLLSAFSTIIGYSKYHYSNILKKFFLMAVLVNFSLPLFGVLIDFSQILMLTFVNGFRAAAAGNFVTMLHLGDVMNISSSSLSTDVGAGDAVEDPMVKKVVAMMFGVVILGISATILAIMMVYLVARIVGLWILLITSPAALFVNGLPDSLQGKVPSLGNEWWGRLWGLLTGGPIMAFFIWLALATASTVGPTFTQNVNYAGDSETESAKNYFQTAMGTVENFGSYIVAVVLLFEGLSAAVKSSSQASPIVGKAAERIKGYGVGATKFLAYGGMATVGAYGARKALGTTGGFIDRNLGITKGVGSGIQKLGLMTGWEGAAATGAMIAGTRGRAVKKQQEKIQKMTEGLSTAKRMDYTRSRLDGILANKDEKKALSEQWTKDMFSQVGQAHLLSTYEAEATKQYGKAPEIIEGDEASVKANEEHKQKVNAFKKQRLMTDQKQSLDDYKVIAGEDEDKKRWIKEKIEATPYLAGSPEEVRKYISNKMEEDPAYARKASAESFENTAVTTALLASAGAIDAGGNFEDKLGVIAKMTQGDGKKAQLLRKTIDEAKARAGGRRLDEYFADTANLSGGVFVPTKDKNEPNKHRLVAFSELDRSEASPAGAPSPAGARPTGERIVREERFAEEHRALQRTREALTRVQDLPEAQREAETSRLNLDLHRQQQDMLRAGASAQEIYGMDRRGMMGNEVDAQSFDQTVNNIFSATKGAEGDGTNYSVYTNLDLGVVNNNPNGNNQARQSLVRHANVSDLGTAYAHADAAGDKSARMHIADIARAIDVEGKQHEKELMTFNQQAKESGKDQADINGVVEAAKAFASATDETSQRSAIEALNKAAAGSGIGMDQATAIAKRQDVQNDVVLRNYSKYATGRGERFIGRAREMGQDVKEGTERVASNVAEGTREVARTVGTKVSDTTKRTSARVQSAVSPQQRVERRAERSIQDVDLGQGSTRMEAREAREQERQARIDAEAQRKLDELDKNENG
jgi:hypothetical protein